MKNENFPVYRGSLEYSCLGCGKRFSIEKLHYTCPECRGVFLLRNSSFDDLKKTPGSKWREIFDARAALKVPELRGIFRFYELMAPVLEQQDIVYLGEGNTPVIPASRDLQSRLGQKFSFKNDGQNPSASFKDRGMACAFSYLKKLVREKGWDQVLTICASTGDTSAAAALYGAYIGPPIKSVVILPQGRVTSQQLSQPLGSGAWVIELPGVFDDCMKVVEYLADNFRVALLNSKNAWRILGQESYAFEVAQWYDWDMSGKSLFVPIGNAGNITAIMGGFLKLMDLGIIDSLPRIFGVQSSHADPVFQYYQANPEKRSFSPVKVKASVAQAAMIGNPVSFPRVRALAEEYQKKQGSGSFQVVQVSEQAIMEGMLLANRNGHIACTQGGECLAGMIRAKEMGILDKDETAVLDATAHALKFSGFQEMYFADSFSREYGITPRKEYINLPVQILNQQDREGMSEEEFTRAAADRIVETLGLDREMF
ncbi:threonine synthase [Desulfonatronovibrio hydrogenovorans]|uniref:threonine synthase n=1 Tax=Desulfonatronovibrio hydrogenovorans TaxID=53245 RepID=UPI00049071DA|nr:threonine synthase [Desulfonatronovibrio hydrogenovorans]